MLSCSCLHLPMSNYVCLFLHASTYVYLCLLVTTEGGFGDILKTRRQRSSRLQDLKNKLALARLEQFIECIDKHGHKHRHRHRHRQRHKHKQAKPSTRPSLHPTPSPRPRAQKGFTCVNTFNKASPACPKSAHMVTW